MNKRQLKKFKKKHYTKKYSNIPIPIDFSDPNALDAMHKSFMQSALRAAEMYGIDDLSPVILDYAYNCKCD